MSRKSTTLRRRVRFERQGRAKKVTTAPATDDGAEPRPLRLSRLMALVIRYQQLIDEGHVGNRADLCELAEVSRARLTQIMNLLLLAPDIQEAIQKVTILVKWGRAVNITQSVVVEMNHALVHAVN